MLKTDLMLPHPLRNIGQEPEDILPPGGFAAIVARAGVGKTALLVQISLNSLLGGKNVLHISLNDPIMKVNLWYKEVFNNIAQHYHMTEINNLWESMQPHRFIMTFKVEGFSAAILQERLTDLVKQKIFVPQLVIIDGLPFSESSRTYLSQLKKMAHKHSLSVWFTVRTHRHEVPDPDGFPTQLKNVVSLFELVIQLQPKGKEIHIKALKGKKVTSDQPALLLDPATMLIKNHYQ
jgi:hypothetical protein